MIRERRWTGRTLYLVTSLVNIDGSVENNIVGLYERNEDACKAFREERDIYKEMTEARGYTRTISDYKHNITRDVGDGSFTKIEITIHSINVE